MKHFTFFHHTALHRQLRPILLSAGTLLFVFMLSFSVQAADTRGVTVSSANNSLGAVFCNKNGSSFEHYTYAQPTDSITVSALPVNKNYNFVNWTDNGVIVSNSSTYSCSVGDKNHVLVAHFDSKPEFKHKRYDTDKNISSITRNTNACDFAPGYKINGMAINTALMPLDDATKAAVEQISGGSFAAAFQINFTFGYAGTPKQTLEHKVRLVQSLPSAASGTCRIVYLSGSAPVLLEDLDSAPETITFETGCSGFYVVTCVPTDAPVTQTQYQESVINILRYQLQQAGLTPAA